ncbi:hypothetical protein LB579_34325 [Mesorhizobium sp. BR1-1-7]|nr:hypothetical protein [Mesorhizobium sp. BR1-1-7]
MNIPGYDNWKLMTPDEDYEASGGTLCPFCGAYSPKQCDLVEESGGICPWEESEPDPDMLMEQRREDREIEARNPRNGDDF